MAVDGWVRLLMCWWRRKVTISGWLGCAIDWSRASWYEPEGWFDVSAKLIPHSSLESVWRLSVSAGEAQQAALLPLWWDLQSPPERSHQAVQGAPLPPWWLWAGVVDVWVPWQELPSLPVLLQQSTVQRHEKRWVLNMNDHLFTDQHVWIERPKLVCFTIKEMSYF